MVDVVAAVLGTMLVLLAPGAALLAALRLDRVVDPLLRPAAAVAGTVALASVALVVTLTAGWSILGMAAVLGVATIALAVTALLRWEPRRDVREPRRSVRERVAAGAWFAPPALVLAVLAVFDSPHVRSDTYWHVALARKLGELDHLSSAAIAFEAGAPGNANYPLPTLHALVALAAELPRVDLWSATWFLTLWAGPVAMLAFGGMAAAFVGDRRAGLAGSWVFVGVVVLGYGPWFFATRYLSYAGQVAIYLVLPIALVALVRVASAGGRARVAHVAVACAATVVIGLLHGNYVLYPVLFATGGAALLAIGRRDAWRGAVAAAGAVATTGVVTLGAQLPWITEDDNFLRGGADPAGEPTAFLRHRDVFTGGEESHHVVLGSLATQPMLVLGALAIPLLLLVARRRPGPWHLAGGAVAIAVFARTPQLIDLIDRLGSVTPATRFDRVYPAAVGVLAVALGLGWLLARVTHRRGGAIGGGVAALALVAVGAASWWADSIRDTRRIVVTQFVEARWVGGLDPDGLPGIAVVAATVATIVAAVWIAVRTRARGFEAGERDLGDARGAARFLRSPHALATLVLVAVVAGLAPASIERAEATWQPEAYRRSLRQDRDVTRIEVYPPATRGVIAGFEPGATVLAAFDDTRKIASLAPVHSVEESVLRELVADPPAAGEEAAERLDELVEQWDADYVAASTSPLTSARPSVASFRAMLLAAEADPEHYEPIASGNLRVFRVNR